MPVLRIASASLMVAAVACGGGEARDRPPAGSHRCGDATVLDVARDGTRRGDAFELRATATTDAFSGSCSGEKPGVDAIAYFAAPAAGRWRFAATLAPEDLVPAVFVLGDCNDGFSERGCGSGAVGVDLATGEGVYVVVDAVGGGAEHPLTLDIAPVAGGAPVVASFEAWLNVLRRSYAVAARGHDAEGDVAAFTLEFLGAGGAPVMVDPGGPPRIDVHDPAVELRTEGTGFTLAWATSVLRPLDAVTALRLTVVDATGAASEPREAAVTAPRVVARGDACDALGARSVCGPADACVGAAAGLSCLAATAPALRTAEAYVNLAVGSFGVRVDGDDPEDDVAAVSLLPLAADGAARPFAGDGAVPVRFTSITQEGGAFAGVVSRLASFQQCLAEGEEAFVACASGGITTRDCAGEGRAVVATCNARELAEVAAMRIAVADRTARTGDAVTVAVSAPAAAEAGAACDAMAALWRCPEGMACHGVDEGDARLTCRDAVPECPGGWEVVDLRRHAVGGGWVYRGTTAGARHKGGGGTCGGGAPNRIHAFVAASDGAYRVEIADTAADTVLYVRSHCALPQPEYELACNDDLAVGNLLSALRMDLVRGQTVYVFVDGATGDVEGEYTLRVRPR
jgi:hypothetical protein